MRIKNFIPSLFLASLGGYFIYLKFSAALPFYIRPDYELFTLVMGVILLIAGLWTLIFDNDGSEHSEMFSKNGILAQVLILLFVSGGILLPRKALTASTAVIRGPNQNIGVGIVKSNVTKDSVSPLLGQIESTGYTIADWMRLFSIDPEPDNYMGREVSLEGFIQPTSDGNFKISRFIVTCCIVDAYPVHIYVNHDFAGFKENDWVRVKGKFITKEVDGKRAVAVETASMEKIPEPASPYFY